MNRDPAAPSHLRLVASATTPTRSTGKGKPPAPDFLPTLARLQQLTRTADSPEDWCPPSADQELLRLCQHALQMLNVGKAAARCIVGLPPRDPAWEESRKADHAASVAIRAAGRIPAATAAGIFAKATVVRASRSGAAVLGQSLAADLIAHPTLRQAMWPVAPEGGA